jgi:DNA-binding response OmpR family regulator
MLATHATAEDNIKALGMGVWELINKPTTDAEVIRIIKVIVSKTDKQNSYCKAK